MDTTQPLPLLGGLTAGQFMKRHWQKKPLLVRGAVPHFQPLLDRSALFELASREDVESRLIAQTAKGWAMRRGPLARRSLPPLSRAGWTMLVQGVDLHLDAADELLSRFRFVPQARLDDLMISWASDGGGVGPHFDSYDVFLLQAQGRRRWRIGRQKDLSLQEGAPLKILANFEPEEEYVLEPGDMLYLPPRYAHDGVAQGECQTYSIGFRAPTRAELARELLQRIADEAEDMPATLYADRTQDATATPGEIPSALQGFARDALRAALDDPLSAARALGEYLTEPKASVWFEPRAARGRMRRVTLDRRTRMMYDAKHVFINGEGYLASGRDAQLMRRLADERHLAEPDLARASEGALALLASWRESGWVHSGGRS
ncbi:JmjC domain-containing protein [Caenimonas aquaedulcis]|uniref:Cupin domain-containing protein n=1 Tax=Caenimonas aquaedulcis TaxID=2793270 RepID=A0A931MFV8_9BURK|nr:cupin domain-containing protein [Caenimonas aquaedulcis]MBG9387573.1 cupin domain-containing protein [Caenimonas aquaedulcis]